MTLLLLIAAICLLSENNFQFLTSQLKAWNSLAYASSTFSSSTVTVCVHSLSFKQRKRLMLTCFLNVF